MIPTHYRSLRRQVRPMCLLRKRSRMICHVWQVQRQLYGFPLRGVGSLDHSDSLGKKVCIETDTPNQRAWKVRVRKCPKLYLEVPSLRTLFNWGMGGEMHSLKCHSVALTIFAFLCERIVSDVLPHCQRGFQLCHLYWCYINEVFYVKLNITACCIFSMYWQL